MNNIYLKHVSLTILGLVLGIALFTTPHSFSTLAGTSKPFGGAITQLFPACVAPAGIALEIGPPTPMKLMYLPGQSRS